MKVLMLGWEFPPFNSGGLGIACKGISEGLISNGTKVSLVLPMIPKEFENTTPSYCVSAAKLLGKKNIIINSSEFAFSPYISETEHRKEQTVKINKYTRFSSNLIEKAKQYGLLASELAEEIDHDIIHAHDWLTFPLAINAKKRSGKPLIVQIHSTEFDRSGNNPSPVISEIEKRGMKEADKVIAVSNFTKDLIVKQYGIDENKIEVVHNAIDDNCITVYEQAHIEKSDKIVLFLGRITMQKGPDYFLEMAKKVLKKIKNVKFVVAGNGDMMNQIIMRSIELGIEKKILFTGFLRGKELDLAFSHADIYVMPSVSEPFGISALEAIQSGTPVLMSKQSGISEVIVNALKVDFWDTDEMANKVIFVLQDPSINKHLKIKALEELPKFTWKNVGNKINHIYSNLITAHAKTV